MFAYQRISSNAQLERSVPRPFVWLTVVVALLGCFVDGLDEWVLSKSSLPYLRLSSDDIANTGAVLLSVQQGADYCPHP